MIIGPRLAFCKTGSNVLCGNGNFVELRESSNFSVLKKCAVFDTTVICGICLLGDKGYLCYGDRKLAILNKEFEVLIRMNLFSWITAVKFLEDETIVVLTAASVLYRIDSDTFKIEDQLQLESFGILISGFVRGNNWNELSVFVGVFDYIKMFYPSKSSNAAKTFLGHTGMIFEFAQLDAILYSISDDRSVRAWDVENDTEIASAFGHNSRPFAIEVSREFGILTAGADQKVCVWKLNNNRFELEKQIDFDGGPIRSLCLIGNNLVVGTDSGSLFSAKLNSDVSNLKMILSMDQSPINAFLHYPNEQYVIVANGSELWIHSNDQQHLLVSDTKFKANILSKIPQTSCFSICTNENKFLVFDFNSREQICSLCLDYLCSFAFWIDQYLIVSSAPEQKCFIYEFSNNNLTYKAVFSLNGRSILVSSGCLFENMIAIGTSRGSLFLLNRQDLAVINSFARAHNKSSVTDIQVVKKKLCSIGKDGRFNIWQFDEHFNFTIYMTFSTVDWPAKLLFDEDADLKYIAGFSGDQFLLVNAQTYLTDFQTYCGGGHRIFEYDLAEQRLNFISKSKVYTIKNNGPNVKKLEGSWHQSEFTSLAIYPLDKEEDRFLIFTGGNDTQITVSEYCSSSDEIAIKSKTNRHVGNIDDLVICGDFLITVGGFSEIYLWKILVEDREIHCLDKQKIDREARLVCVDARLIDDLLLLAIAESCGSIELFEYSLDGQLKRRRSVELDGVLSYTKVCFANDSLLGSITTSGHLICYELDTEDKFSELSRTFIEKNSLTALSTNGNIVVMGSVAGRLSATKLDGSCAVSTQLAHGSTVTDIQINVTDKAIEIFSVSLDRCVVVSTFDDVSNELTILRTIAHAIYDPSRIRLLNNKSSRRKCIVTGYGLETVYV